MKENILFNVVVPRFDSQTVVEDLVRRAHMPQTDDLVIGVQLVARENLLAWYCDMCAKKGLLPEGVEKTVVSARGVLDCRGIGFTSRRLLSEEGLVRSSPAGLEMRVVRHREPSEHKEQNLLLQSRKNRKSRKSRTSRTSRKSTSYVAT